MKLGIVSLLHLFCLTEGTRKEMNKIGGKGTEEVKRIALGKKKNIETQQILLNIDRICSFRELLHFHLSFDHEWRI